MAKRGIRSFHSRDRARAMLEAGAKNVDIADALGCSTSTVIALKVELGFPVRVYEPRGKKREPSHRGPEPAKRGGAGANREHPEFAGYINGMLDQSAAPLPRTAEDKAQWRELQAWPAGIHFEDADVPPEPRAVPKPDLFGIPSGGNGTAMAAAKRGFV